MAAVAHHRPAGGPDLAHHPVVRPRRSSRRGAGRRRAAISTGSPWSIATRSASAPGRIAPQSRASACAPPPNAAAVERRARPSARAGEHVAGAVAQALAVFQRRAAPRPARCGCCCRSRCRRRRRRPDSRAVEDAVAEVRLGDRAEPGDRAGTGEAAGLVRRSSGWRGSGTSAGRCRWWSSRNSTGRAPSQAGDLRPPPATCSAAWMCSGPSGSAAHERRELVGRGGAKRMRRDAERRRRPAQCRRASASRAARKPSRSLPKRSWPPAERLRAGAAVAVEHRQQRQPDAGRRRPPRRCGAASSAGVGIGRAAGLVVQIVELGDAAVAGLQHLDIGQRGDRLDVFGGQQSRKRYISCRQVQKLSSPGPPPLGHAGHRPLEGVAVEVGHRRQQRAAGQARVARAGRGPRSTAAMRPASIVTRTSRAQPSGSSASGAKSVVIAAIPCR